MRLSYYFWNEKNRRMCGYSIIEQENWDQQQTFLYSSRPDCKLTMVAIKDPKLLTAIRENGPQNYTIKKDGTPALLPPEQRNLTAQIVVMTDDQLMSLNAGMNKLIALMEALPAKIAAATTAGIKESMK